MTLLRNINGGVLLCCGKAKCPVVKVVDDNKVTITDDDGNTIKVDIDQANLLPQAIEQLKNNK